MPDKLTKKQFEREMQQLAQRVSNLNPLPETGKQRRLKKAAKDKEFFARTYFPDYVTHGFTGDHREIFSLTDDTEQPQAILGYRGLGKSVIASLIDPAHKILFKKKRFLLFISETSSKATEEFVGPLRVQLESNARIMQDFGSLTTHGMWEWDDFTTSTNVRVKAMSWRQSPRSLRNGPHRPDHEIFEDIENPRQGDSPKIMKRKTKAILEDFIGAAELTDFTAFYVGNYTRKPSVTHNIVTSDEFQEHIYPLLNEFPITENTRSRWPEKFPMPTVKKILRKLGTVGFSKEMMQRPESDSGVIKEEWIRYYHPSEIANRDLRIFIYGDPRKAGGTGGDGSDDAVIVLGVDPNDLIMYVLYAFIRKSSDLGMLRQIYNQYELFPKAKPGIETNVAGRYLQNAIDMVAKERGYRLSWTLVHQRLNKEDRISRLGPFIERAEIRFRKGHSDQDRLVQQLVDTPDWPDGNDGADALEGAVTMHEQGRSAVVESELY